MNRTYTFLLFAIAMILTGSCKSKSSDSFPLLNNETQKSIIERLSKALNIMTQASIPIGGDTETYWAAEEVEKLHDKTIKANRPFLQDITTIYQMQGLFAYGMNYVISNYGMSVCPELAKDAFYSVSVCDSLIDNVVQSRYSDIMAIADLSSRTYYQTQLHLSILNKLNQYDDNSDDDLEFSLQVFDMLQNAKSENKFNDKELLKAYFILDSVCFYKAFIPLVAWFAPTEEKYNEYGVQIMKYASYFDKVSTPVYETILSEVGKGLNMNDEEFEEFMIESTEAKVGIMEMITEGMIATAQQEK